MPTEAIVVVDMQDYFCKPNYAFLRFIAALGGEEETESYQQRLDSAVIPNIDALVKAARRHGDLVIFTEFGSTEDGGLPPWARRHNDMANDLIGESIYLPVADTAARTIGELPVLDTDVVVPRSTSGPLAGTNVADAMRNAGVEHVVLVDVATDVCVAGWTRELADSGFRVSVPVDACASPLQKCHDAALAMMIPAFAMLTETEAFLMTYR